MISLIETMQPNWALARRYESRQVSMTEDFKRRCHHAWQLTRSIWTPLPENDRTNLINWLNATEEPKSQRRIENLNHLIGIYSPAKAAKQRSVSDWTRSSTAALRIACVTAGTIGVGLLSAPAILSGMKATGIALDILRLLVDVIVAGICTFVYRTCSDTFKSLLTQLIYNVARLVIGDSPSCS